MTTPIDRDVLRRTVATYGFDDVRFCAAGLPSRISDEFRAFLADGRAGDMEWLTTTADRRADLRVLWPEARSVIVVAANYGPSHDPRDDVSDTGAGVVSVYARYDDYHDVLKKRLKAVTRWLVATYGGDAKVFVDTAPILEKPLAQQAGIGWQGKHTNVVSRRFGSWLFLAEIVTTLDIAPDLPEADHCGACRQCLDVCPTNAFLGPYRLDPRKCVSYLTIEHKGHIPEALRRGIGNRIYGCDACLATCPWNKFAQKTTEPAFLPRAALTAPRLTELASLDDAAFRALFAKSPVKRVGRARFIRNVALAIGNSGDRALAPSVVKLLDDPSPLIRAAAIWALSRLTGEREFAVIRDQYRPRETDREVAAEWAA